MNLQESEEKTRVNKCYVIQELVYFYPEERRIESVITGESKTLHTPSAMCLLKLIEPPGELRTQSELLKAGWGELAQYTSLSTYYQSFTHLRRQFNALGMPEKLIITVPRRGIQLNPQLTIATREPSVPPVIVEESVIQDTALSRSDRVALTRRFTGMMLQEHRYIACLLIFTAILSGSIYPRLFPGTYFDRFEPIGSPENCFYFLEDTEDDAMASARQTLNQHHYTCDSGKKYYIQTMHQAAYLTFLACDRLRKHCSSVTIMARKGAADDQT